MSAYILPSDGSDRIIEFHAVLSEQHESISEVSQHPVEGGQTITDHVMTAPDQFSMIGIMTNTPIDSPRGETRAVQLDLPARPPEPGGLLTRAINALTESASPPQAVIVTQYDQPFDAVSDMLRVLQELQRNGVLLTIATAVRLYENVVITRVTAPRDDSADAIEFGLDVQQIRIVRSGTVAAPPVPADDIPGGKPLADKGSQGKKPGKNKEVRGSIAYELLKEQGFL